jgi:WD40 repeat protein
LHAISGRKSESWGRTRPPPGRTQLLRQLPRHRWALERGLVAPGLLDAHVSPVLRGGPMRHPVVVIPILLLCVAAPVRAQCPDGTPPPCARPAAPVRQPTAAPRAVYRQITTSGRSDSPAISPNGAFLAYWDSAGLLVRSLAPGGSANVVLAPGQRRGWGAVELLGWTVDGTRLLLASDSTGLVALPMTGGTPQVLMQGLGAAYRISASPGGDRVAYWSPDRMAVYLRSLSGAGDTVSVPGGDAQVRAVTWSPDGNAWAVLTSDGLRRSTLRLVSLRGRASRVLLQDSVDITWAEWNGAAAVIYYLRQNSNFSQVWKLPVTAMGVPTGGPSMVLPMLEVGLTTGVSRKFSVADDGTLAYSRFTSTANIWEAALTGDTTRRWLTRGTGSVGFPAYSPDGRSIAFVRSEGATANLWVARNDSGAAQQVTFLEEGRIGSHAWSPDGRRIAFCQYGVAPPSIGIVSVAGGAIMRPSTLSVSPYCRIGWLSSDEVFYSRAGWYFAVHSLRGQPARHLVTNDSIGEIIWALADPTGRVLALFWDRPHNGGSGLWLISLADSSQRLLRAGGIRPFRWAMNGEALYAQEYEAPHRFFRVPLAAPDSATPVTGPHGCLDDISPDGTRVLCVDGTSASDVWLIRNFDPTAPPPPAPRRR